MEVVVEGTGNSLLIDAVRAGDEYEVKRLCGSQQVTDQGIKDAFVIAAGCNRLNIVKALYDALQVIQADINVTHSYREKTALEFAIPTGNIEIVDFILKEKPSINPLRNDYSPFITMFGSKNIEIAEKVIEYAPWIIDTSVSGNCLPLAIVAEVGNEAMVRLLLEHKADPNGQPRSKPRYSFFSWGYPTPLSLAVRHNHQAVVHLLLEAGADMHRIDPNGENVLHHAVRFRYGELVKTLLAKGIGTSQVNKSGKTPLALAVENNHQEIVKLLLEKGADMHRIDPNGQPGSKSWYSFFSWSYSTLLSLAVRHNHQDTEKGADMHRIDPNGENVLHHAVRQECVALVRALLAKGIDTNQVNKNGKTPFSVAVEHNHQEIVHLLLEAGADIRQIDRNDEHVLYDAIRLGNAELVKILLAKDIDTNQVNKFGKTPLDVAREVLELEAASSGDRHKISKSLIMDQIVMRLEVREGKSLC